MKHEKLLDLYKFIIYKYITLDYKLFLEKKLKNEIYHDINVKIINMNFFYKNLELEILQYQYYNYNRILNKIQ